MNEHVPRVLTIAGSDSGGGAGIQADLKTLSALGVYGLSAITAITAQNTEGVRDAVAIAPRMIEEQIDAVMEDIGADAAKTGMLCSAAIISTVARSVRKWRLRVVVDPVMRSTSGTPLLQPDAVATLCSDLLPLAEVVTPNIPEAEILVGGRSIETLDAMREAAQTIHAMGPRYVVVTGGHASGEPVDVYFDGDQFVEFGGERIQTRHTHGTGCTFSAAIAACLALGLSVREAVGEAKYYITNALRHVPNLGHGHGPLEHFWHYKDIMRK